MTVNSGHGSIRITKARENKHHKLSEKERDESLAAAKADAREENATMAWQEWVNLSYHFGLCEIECVCEKNDACLAKKFKNVLPVVTLRRRRVPKRRARCLLMLWNLYLQLSID